MKFLFAIIFFCHLGALTYAQNDKPLKRSAFTLKLYAGSDSVYEARIDKSPFFIKRNVLQIYPGESVFVELDQRNWIISSEKAVAANHHPSKTIVIRFVQKMIDKNNCEMILQISNPFSRTIFYAVRMLLLRNHQWVDTDVVPLGPKQSGYEKWPDPIVSLAVYNIRFEDGKK